MPALLLGVGLLLTLSGGFALVHGASHLARRWGVPAFVVGLTVVAFGTSAPELAVNVLASLRGDADISFGNVVGSNLANLGLILGVAALITPLAIESTVIRREIPMMLLATGAIVVMALDPLLTDAPAAYDRSDGWTLLVFFSVFLYTAAATVLRRREADTFVGSSIGVLSSTLSAPRCAALIIAGLAALIWGADVTLRNAVVIATDLGVAPAIIGLSVVALGTSLPELVASTIAASRGESDLAVGNVVGSNIFNILFILGVTSSIGPVPVPDGGGFDLAALTAVSALLLIFAATGRRISRAEGAALVLVWLGYGIWRLVSVG